ncbi:hypothetical protein EIN_047110 [Entamoeba invadens IP1]|uniref:Phospholipid-transporting ATPase n=1 Tax=Entamoeba invadens IP1 TaxID=370355 RepID=A0A0A1UDC0_ENTIV|nr:hypothetical protein EIN_047110 [Entamoeba invadens IP1]ELP94428.1 hypothetical protein EIN_047110 [Entamoeba invadens IP1]|eukprot:XP_004261199.1 hypothetical protein EIN_047110 [Entamoeba invadens IP1]
MVRRIRLFKTRPRESYQPIRLFDDAVNKKKHFPNNVMRTTKYTLLSFPLKFLYQQFTMVTNLYFLAIMIICCIPSISTVTPITSIVPLIFVLLVAAVKEIYEDSRRRLADRKFNQSKFVKHTPDGDVDVTSSDIKTGMFIKLRHNEIVPADCIPLFSSNEEGIVYVETAAIDGETNLKQILVPGYFIGTPIEKTFSNSGDLICEYPQPRFDQFKASLSIGENKISINEKNLLIQGTKIKNTEIVYAVVCYCGEHTKLSLNQTPPQVKKSRIDKKFNIFVFVMIVVQTVICLVLALVAGFRHSTLNDAQNGFWYLPKDSESPFYYGFKKFFGYFTLISYIIPISCQVSLELCKFLQGLFIEHDDDMKIRTISPEGEEQVLGMNAKSTNLNDELGMVRYVLSDKTGTLTENIMKFKACSVGKGSYGYKDLIELLRIVRQVETESVGSECSEENAEESDNGTLVVETLKVSSLPKTDFTSEQCEKVVSFITCMAICNTVSVNNGTYSAQSPDEEALCKAAKDFGIELVSRNQKTVTLNVFGTLHIYSILAVFEFNSDRKRMSTLVRKDDGTIELWTKGADNVMDQLCEGDKSSLSQIVKFSECGLRTLVLAKRVVSDSEFAPWYERYDDATNILEGRDDAINQLQNEMECKLEIVGVSAIEDKLQDGVCETIDMLIRAGIKIFMITGDKMETAINIGKSCKLITGKYFTIAEQTAEECSKKLDEILGAIDADSGENCTLVITEKNNDWCLTTYRNKFKKLVKLVDSVVCCRVTPKEKAEITKCVKKMTGEVVLTIGDGANDVPMINTGSVGVGIYGKEGTQAARASDFAIRKFRHLGKLILFHGRCSLLRNSELIKLCFFKNAAFFLIMLSYSFLSNCTAQVVYDDYVMTFFNILFTQIQPILIGVFDRDLTWQTIRVFPEINRDLIDGHRGSVWNFVLWWFYGAYQSLIFFLVFYWIILPTDVNGPNGINGGMIYTSLSITIYSLLTVIVTIIIETKTWNGILFAGHVVSLICIIVIYTLTCYIPGYSTYNISWHGYYLVFRSFDFYLVCLLVVMLSVTPLILRKFIQRRFFPSLYHLAQEMENVKGLNNYGQCRNIPVEGSSEVKELLESCTPAIPKNLSLLITKSRFPSEVEMSIEPDENQTSQV